MSSPSGKQETAQLTSPEGSTSWTEELLSQRDAAIKLSRQLGQELESKKQLLEGRLENAHRLCGEAEARLSRVRRDYHSKHLTLRKRILSVAGTLAIASFGSWVLCALAASQKWPVHCFAALLPVTGLVTLGLFTSLHTEGIKLLIPA